MLKKFYSTSFNLLKNNKFDNNYANKCGGYKTKGLFKKNQPDIDLPLFSIITVVYNNVSQIKRCMDSVFNQTYENIEYIVIDGGSTDGTLDLIKEDEGKLDLWISEKDDGIYDAINKGINFSNGFTLMLHSDDQLYDKNTLERVSRCIKNQSTLYFGKVENYNEYVKWTYPNKSSEVDEEWFLKNMIPHQSSFIFADIHKNHLFKDKKISIGNDALILGSIAQKYNALFMDIIISKVELGGDSNNWKSLKRVYDYNNQTFIVNKKLGREMGIFQLIYQHVRGTIQYVIFNYFGRKVFYKIFYRKFTKKN